MEIVIKMAVISTQGTSAGAASMTPKNSFLVKCVAHVEEEIVKILNLAATTVQELVVAPLPQPKLPLPLLLGPHGGLAVRTAVVRTASGRSQRAAAVWEA